MTTSYLLDIWTHYRPSGRPCKNTKPPVDGQCPVCGTRAS